MDSADPDALEHQLSLLRVYGIESIEEMHNLLFNREYNYQRVHTHREGYVTQSQSQQARNHSFAELFASVDREEGVRQSDRKMIQFKYQKDELIRGHQQHQQLWLMCANATHRMRRH